MRRPFLAVIGMALLTWGMSATLRAQQSVPRQPPVAVPTPTVPSPSGGPLAAALPDPVCTGEPNLSAAPGRYWAEAEYLMWWVRGAQLPPLVTTSPAGTPIEQAGVLGTPGATVLFGGKPVNGDLRSGGRITLGAWLDDCSTVGVEANFLYLGPRNTGFAAGSAGSPILSRPIIDATTGLPAAERVAFPGDLAGTVRASANSDGLIGAGILARKPLCGGCNYRVDGLYGYRFLRFDESLVIAEGLVNTNPNSPVFVPFGTRFDLFDRFKTENQFHGLDVGLAGECFFGPLTLRVLGKVAVGCSSQVVNIAGATTVTVPGATPVTSQGGLLALPSNIGRYQRYQLGVVPEVGVQLGYQFSPRLRGWVGYTFLCWDDVVRPGDQVSLRVNPNLIPPAADPAPGPREPAFHFRDTSWWAQGINLGVDFRF